MLHMPINEFANKSPVHVLRQLFVVLLLCMKLEVHNVSLVQGNLLVVTDIDLFSTLATENCDQYMRKDERKERPTHTSSNLPDQTNVVRNHEDTSLELIEASRECINRFHICGNKI